MKLEGKKILVTGGAGFIGSHLVDALMTSNSVTVLDNLTSGEEQNISHHKGKENFNFIRGDINDVALIKGLMHDNQVVFHLAVQCLRISLSDPFLVHEVNATGTLNLCQAALEEDIERFIYVSSSEVYGTAKTAPMSEDHTLEPTTPYGASKLAGESYARSYFLTFGLPVTVIRPFNTYGPREHLVGPYGEVIPKFVSRVLNNQPPVIFGDGEQTRDFTYTEDTVRGMVAAAECDALVGDTINIADGNEVSINEIARNIISILGKSELQPSYRDARPGDVRRHYADISKAQKMLGFSPRVDIKTGIQKYIDFVRSQNPGTMQNGRESDAVNWILKA